METVSKERVRRNLGQVIDEVLEGDPLELTSHGSRLGVCLASTASLGRAQDSTEGPAAFDTAGPVRTDSEKP